ncbi:MAG TPA: hypothetical protein VK358_16110 [Longimicrobium sp.]|nr:hypothetical protein [Longimicrobium sp.]
MSERFGAVQSGQRKSLVCGVLAAEIARIPRSPPGLPAMQNPQFRAALQRYARIRKSAYDAVTHDALASGLVAAPLRLADCDPHTLSIWRATWTDPHPSGWGGWDWEPLLRRAWRHPSAFQLAIWSNKVLCGLAVGRVSGEDKSGQRNAVFVDNIESSHDPGHPLRGAIATLVIDAADTYGRALQASHVRLVEPLPGVLWMYERLGFATVWRQGRALYCERRIEP